MRLVRFAAAVDALADVDVAHADDAQTLPR